MGSPQKLVGETGVLTTDMVDVTRPPAIQTGD
jgi:hypothetical protein